MTSLSNTGKSGIGSILKNLGKATDELRSITERLSSGVRINKASDDAAGLALSEQLKSKSKLYGKAALNISDGISAASIMSEALNAQENVLLQMEELASLASSTAITSTQRTVYNNEYQALRIEYNRIANSAEFNGQKLLRSNSAANPDLFGIQAGIRGTSGDIINVTLADTTTSTGSLEGLIPQFLGVTQTFSQGAQRVIDDINANGSRAVSWTVAQIQSFAGPGTAYAITNGMNGTTSRDVLLLAMGSEGRSVELMVFERNTVDPTRWDTVISPIDSLRLINANNAPGPADGRLAWDENRYVTRDEYTGTTGDYGTRIGNIESGGSVALLNTSLSSASNAALALTAVQASQTLVERVQGTVGAEISRLGFALDFVGAAKNNADFAAARITDIDAASDLARSVSLQMVQQSGISLLASANQNPLTVKSLLDL